MSIELSKASRFVGKYGISFYSTCDPEEGKKIHDALEDEGKLCVLVREGKHSVTFGYSETPAGVLTGLMEPSHYLAVSTIMATDEELESFMDGITKICERTLDEYYMDECT